MRETDTRAFNDKSKQGVMSGAAKGTTVASKPDGRRGRGEMRALPRADRIN